MTSAKAKNYIKKGERKGREPVVQFYLESKGRPRVLVTGFSEGRGARPEK